MKPIYINWLIAGIGALLLMSSFSVYITVRDRKAIDASFESCRLAVDSLYKVRDEQLLYSSSRDSISQIPVSITALRDLRIRAAENKILCLHKLADTQNLVHSADHKKLLWSSLMGVAGLIGLAIIFAGKKRVTA